MMSSRFAKIEKILNDLCVSPNQMVEFRALEDDCRSTEKALRCSEAHSRAILDTAVEGIITIDDSGLIESANSASERMFGYSRNELIGENVSILMSTPNREKHDQYIRNYLETGKANIIGMGRETIGQRKNGTQFAVHLSVGELHLNHKRYFTGIIQDISKRKDAERALEQEKRVVSAILETAGALIVVADLQGRILRFNRACEVTTGYQSEEVAGKIVWDLFVRPTDIPSMRRLFQDLANGPFDTKLDSFWRTKSGDERLISWANTCLTDETGAVTNVIATGIDITEQKRAEESLVYVSESIRKMIGQELHDALGQHLTGVSLLAKTLESKLIGEASDIAQDANEITHLAGEAVKATHGLAHGLYPVELELQGLQASLAGLAGQIENLGKAKCKFHDLSKGINVNHPPALHLYRIAQEAANNAIKHSSADTIYIHLRSIDEDLVLMVSDNGRGFDYGAQKEKGLGLTSMKYRARMIGSTFEIESTPGEGTQVCCRVPRDDVADDRAQWEIRV